MANRKIEVNTIKKITFNLDSEELTNLLFILHTFVQVSESLQTVEKYPGSVLLAESIMQEIMGE
jgi:hypothetical protein